MPRNILVGSPVERVEDERFLRGSGSYVGDLAPPGLLHAAILRSPFAHARLLGTGTERALAMEGVIAVLTASDIGSPVPLIPLRQQAIPEGEAYRQPVIAEGRLRYVGEPVALVIAESAAIAEDALELIELDVEALPAVVDMARDAPLLFEAAGSNRPYVFQARKGDADEAFATADYTRRERFGVQRHMALPMETRGLLAEWDIAARRLIVHGAAKVPFYNRSVLAWMLGMEVGAVDMMEVDVGGGFGARGEFYPEDFLIPFAARHLQRPVRWVEDRREHFTAMNHARAMEAEVEIACRTDGTILAVRGTIDVDLGAYVRTNGFTAPRNVAQFLSGPYRIPNIALDAPVHMTNKTPAGTYRGPGRFESSFFCERLIDMAAADLGIDPVEMRMRNLVSEEEMPYPLARMGHVDPTTYTECDSGRYATVLRRCLDLFGWDAKKHLQGRQSGGVYHGIGMGCFIEGGAAGPREGACLTIEEDGSVTVAVGSSALGQGLETILAQIAADALEIPMHRVTVRHGSTTLVKEGFGSFHSRSTVMGGSAVLVTAEALLDELRRAAADRLGCAAEAVTVSAGQILAGGRTLGLRDFAGLAVERSFTNKKPTYSYGAHAVHLTADPMTGRVTILDYVTVEDVGRIINPATLHGQVLGSVVQGLGSVFLEQIHYDAEGQILTGSLADYLMPSATDFPVIRSLSLELCPSPNNPLGAKGAGEGGLIAVGGAAANALAAALRDFDVRPNHLPLSPPAVWRMVQAARARVPA